MRRATIAFAALGFVLLVGGQARADYQTSETGVKDACGSKLQTSKDGMGCTKCNKSGNYCQDFSCNKTNKGPGKGCFVTTIGPADRKATPAGKGRAGERVPQGHATVTGTPKRHVPSHVSGEAVVGAGKFHGKSVEGVRAVGVDKMQANPPFDRHGGGRASNNRRH